MSGKERILLLHCGKRRAPYKKTDIRSPKQMLYGTKSWIDGNRFETVSIYEFRCPGCFKAKGEQSVFGWVGYPFHPNEKPTPLYKIPAKHLNQWLGFMRDFTIPDHPSGVWTVQGSERQWPYRFRNKVSL